jgi:hypothetical protein
MADKILGLLNMKKTHKKRFDIAFKAILLLCLSVTVFGDWSQRGKITVYLGDEDGVGYEFYCPDSFTIEDIKLRVEVGSKTRFYLGGCMCVTRAGMLVRENADTLYFMQHRPVERFYFTKEVRQFHRADGSREFYDFHEAIVDTAFLQRFNENLDAFEKSPASCTYREPLLKPRSKE